MAELSRRKCAALGAATACYPNRPSLLEAVGHVRMRWYFVVPGEGVHVLDASLKPERYLVHELCSSIVPSASCELVEREGCEHVDIIKVDEQS